MSGHPVQDLQGSNVVRFGLQIADLTNGKLSTRLMLSSRLISLFSDPPPSRSGPSAFVISMLVHGVVLGLTYLGLHRPHVTVLPRDQRVALRLLELHRPDLQPPLPAPNGTVYAPSGAVASAAAAADASGSMPTVPKELLNLTKAQQTLVQPDLPPNITRPQEVPIPAALLWSKPDVHMATIAPPERLDTTARVSPSLRPPNHEQELGDVAISSTSFTTDTPALPPSTTSPVVVPGPAFEQKVLEMWSDSTRPPAPATVISASQMEMADGTIALPSINEVAAVPVGDKLSPGRGGSSTLDGSGEADSKATLPGTGAAESKAPGFGAQNNALASQGSPAMGGNQGPLLKNGSPRRPPIQGRMQRCPDVRRRPR